MASFESTKSEIVSSGLGRAIGLTVSSTWAQIVAKIKAIVNRGALNWSGSNTTYGVPAGYYSGGTLDSRPSYNAGVAAADARVNIGSASYTSGYNAGVTAKTTQYKTGIWTMTRAGFLTLGFQPNVFMCIDNADLEGFPLGIFCSLTVNLNYMEGPSNTHKPNIFYVNGNGIGLNDVALSYIDSKTVRYFAAKII